MPNTVAHPQIVASTTKGKTVSLRDFAQTLLSLSLRLFLSLSLSFISSLCKKPETSRVGVEESRIIGWARSPTQDQIRRTCATSEEFERRTIDDDLLNALALNPVRIRRKKDGNICTRRGETLDQVVQGSFLISSHAGIKTACRRCLLRFQAWSLKDGRRGNKNVSLLFLPVFFSFLSDQ